jgi:hypothetical protein
MLFTHNMHHLRATTASASHIGGGLLLRQPRRVELRDAMFSLTTGRSSIPKTTFPPPPPITIIVSMFAERRDPHVLLMRPRNTSHHLFLTHHLIPNTSQPIHGLPSMMITTARVTSLMNTRHLGDLSFVLLILLDGVSLVEESQ